MPVDTARPVIDDAKEAVLAFIPRRGVDPASTSGQAMLESLRIRELSLAKGRDSLAFGILRSYDSER